MPSSTLTPLARLRPKGGLQHPKTQRASDSRRGDHL